MLALIGSGHRTHLPSSRARIFSRITLFDVFWAGISPILAFLLRDGAINQIDTVAVYGCVALVVSIIIFQWFRISSPIADFFSIHDAITLSKACLTVVALTAALLFSFTRLDSAPRSVPIIHFLVLGCGLIGARALRRLINSRHMPQRQAAHDNEVDYVIVVGATRLAWFFSKMVEELYARERRIVAIIDERPELIHRTLNGYPIIGSADDLARVIDEYATHGVEITKVVVAAHPRDLRVRTRAQVGTVCNGKNIPVEWLHETLAVSSGKPVESCELPVSRPDLARSLSGRPYWKVKRLLDIAVALAMIITFAPLTLLVAGLVLIDVGYPVVFWQQRIGQFGRSIRVYKFRTMRVCHDDQGRPIPESERLSFVGRLLRKNHLDEIPQLFNILGGSMSIVGPRPLLPVDQPANIRFRLDVRPGLTGLAQISGGTLLSADEKDALDDWYAQHASLVLDVWIIFRTIWVILRGNRRNETQISAMVAKRYVDADSAFAHIAQNDPVAQGLASIRSSASCQR